MSVFIFSSFLLYPPISQRHILQSATLEYVDSVPRPVDDGLAVQVERSIEYDALPGAHLVLFKQAVIIGIVFGGYFVRARRKIVWMLRRRKGGPPIGTRGKRKHHVLRSDRLGLEVILIRSFG